MKNWVSHTAPRSRNSQPFSFLLLGVLISVIFDLVPSTALAQTTTRTTTIKDERQNQESFERGQNIPKNSRYPFIPKSQKKVLSTWDEIKKNLHGSYFVSIMGPSLVSNGNTTYNIFLEDDAPIQLFHGVQLSYKISSDFELGARGSLVQPLVNGVIGRNGSIYNDQPIWFDPVLFGNFPNLIRIPGWSVFSSLSVALSVTKDSIDQNRITALELSQTWSPVWANTPWNLSLRWYLNPRFYAVQIPSTFTNRQTLIGSVGHTLTYQVSPVVNFGWSTNFDFDHREPDPKGAFHFNPNLPDYSRITMGIFPKIAPYFLSLGGYLQFLTFKPAADTSIVGGSISIGF